MRMLNHSHWINSSSYKKSLLCSRFATQKSTITSLQWENSQREWQQSDGEMCQWTGLGLGLVALWNCWYLACYSHPNHTSRQLAGDVNEKQKKLLVEKKETIGWTPPVPGHSLCTQLLLVGALANAARAILRNRCNHEWSYPGSLDLL